MKNDAVFPINLLQKKRRGKRKNLLAKRSSNEPHNGSICGDIVVRVVPVHVVAVIILKSLANYVEPLDHK